MTAPARAAALRDMATVTSIVGQMPGERPAAWWLEVARIVCERHGIKTLAEHHDDEPGVPGLTARMVDVLALSADGLQRKQIATRLGISEDTVRTHLRRAYAALGANNAAHAVALAIRAHLI